MRGLITWLIISLALLTSSASAQFRDRFPPSQAANQTRRNLLLTSTPDGLSRTIYHYRHYASTGNPYLDLDYYFVPVGGNLYAGYAFKQYTGTSVRTLGTVNEYRPGLWTGADSASFSGSWSTAADNSIYVAGTPDTAGGNYRSNAVSGSTATFSGATMTGNAIVLVIAAHTNNGYATVSLDGSATGGANRLPVITSSMIVSNGGNFLDADLGKTYIDFYAGGFIGDEHVCIAEGLDEDTQHSLVITVRGTKGTTASGGVSVRIVGAIACRRDSLPTTANHRMGRVRKVNDNGDGLSAMTSVIGWAADAVTANNRIMGENHVGTDVGVVIAESSVSIAITDAAGSTITPTRGTYATSTSFQIDRVTTLTRAGTDICTKRCVYVLDASKPMHCLVTGSVNFITAGYLHSTYFGMIPAYQHRDRYGSVYEKTDFNRALVGDRLIPNVEWVSGGSIEWPVKGADTITLFSTTHDTVWLTHMPRPDLNVDNWLNSGNNHTFLRSVANTTPPGGLKGYFSRVSESVAGGVPQALPAGSVIDFVVGWRLFRIKRAAQLLQMQP